MEGAGLTAVRKQVDEIGLTSDDGFPRMSETHYLSRLSDLHMRLRPKTYFEIGTESGASLAFATCRSFAVDPRFRLEGNIVASKPALHLYQGTSDAFFEENILGKLGVSLDLAFLDGMHLFEYLLRDFINAEKNMDPDGMIVMHDCVPVTHAMAKRDWDKSETISWTGDVWKMIPILQRYRPDLSISVRNYAPTGLVEIQGLDPNNTVLFDKYIQIVNEFSNVTLDEFGLTNFVQTADIQPVQSPFLRKSPPPDTRQIAIKTSVPTAADCEHWGDFHFARGLSSALQRLGVGARIDPIEDWRGQAKDSLDIVIQGHDHFPAGPERPSINWIVYPGKRFPHASVDAYDHVFCSGEPFIRKLAKRAPNAEVSYLPQAFDADVMAAVEKPEKSEPVFVGNRHFQRPIVDHALASDQEIRVWGNGWDQSPASMYVVNAHIPNAALPEVYGNASAVLCDHLPVMARNGFVSNRIYDALACGAPVISDPVAGMSPEFQEFVHIVMTPDEFREALEAVRGEDQKMRARRIEFAESMRNTDSFDQRARSILSVAENKGLI